MYKFRLINLFWALIFFCVGMTDLYGNEPYSKIPQLNVKGEAQLRKPADEFRLSIGVVTEDLEAQKALASNTAKMNALIKNLSDIGLPSSQLQTGQFNIQPIYFTPPKDPDENWKHKIVGYEVTNSLNIRSDKIDLVGKIIDTAVQAGANLLQSIEFTLKDQREYLSEAITTAIKNAIFDAKVLATGANVKLVRILNIKLEDTTPPRPRFHSPMFFSKAMDSGSAPVVEPGDVEITSQVNVVYEITSQ